MRINSHNTPSTEISAERTSTKPPSTSDAPQVSQGDKFGGDTVSLRSLAAQTLHMPAVRQDKVDALREKVESGEYRADPRGTAEAMLNG